MNNIILDCGGGSIKGGFATESRPFINMPNCIGVTKQFHNLVGDETISKIKDQSNLRYKRCFERGFLVDFNVEEEIWNRLFGKQILDISSKLSSCNLLITEPLLNFESIQETMNEVIFETFNFNSCYRLPTPPLIYSSAKHNRPSLAPLQTALIIDTGYSATNICVVVGGKVVMDSIRRIDVGGKFLTNVLIEAVSFRCYDMREDSFLVNDVKEKMCFTSLNFVKDLETVKLYGAKGPLKREYVLPDYKTVFHGFVKEDAKKEEVERKIVETNQQNPAALSGDEQSLIMNAERFAIPEILFHPSDIGLYQCGLAEAVVESIQATHIHTHSELYQNIIVSGGNSLFPNFIERLEKEIRLVASSCYEVKVHHVDDPINAAWHGGALAFREEYTNAAVSRKEYQESGHNIFYRKEKSNIYI